MDKQLIMQRSKNRVMESVALTKGMRIIWAAGSNQICVQTGMHAQKCIELFTYNNGMFAALENYYTYFSDDPNANEYDFNYKFIEFKSEADFIAYGVKSINEVDEMWAKTYGKPKPQPRYTNGKIVESRRRLELEFE